MRMCNSRGTTNQKQQQSDNSLRYRCFFYSCCYCCRRRFLSFFKTSLLSLYRCRSQLCCLLFTYVYNTFLVSDIILLSLFAKHSTSNYMQHIHTKTKNQTHRHTYVYKLCAMMSLQGQSFRP